MDYENLKLDFCGPGKAISETALQELEAKIQSAKQKGERYRKVKKQLKREYVQGPQHR